MRKLLSWMSVLILIPLVACSFGMNNPRPDQPAAGITPTLSNEQMQTQLAQLLTMMPTSTGQPAGETMPTVALPTVVVATETATAEDPAAGAAAPSPTAAPAATDTPQPAAPAPTSTNAPEAGGGPAATATTAPTATAIPSGASTPLAPDNPASRLGSPASVDPMNDSFTWNWPTGSHEYSEAWFANGQMAIKGLTTKDGWRLANPIGQAFTDIYLETNFVVKDKCQTDAPGMADHYGVIVRVPDIHQPINGYLFGFNCNGQYSLRSWSWNGEDERRQDMQMLIDWTTPKDNNNNNIIRGGTQATNAMGMMMIGSRLRLYANGYYLAEYDFSKNTTIPQVYSGYFGAFVGSRNDTKFTIWVDQMAYWLNPKP